MFNTLLAAYNTNTRDMDLFESKRINGNNNTSELEYNVFNLICTSLDTTTYALINRVRPLIDINNDNLLPTEGDIILKGFVTKISEDYEWYGVGTPKEVIISLLNKYKDNWINIISTFKISKGGIVYLPNSSISYMTFVRWVNERAHRGHFSLSLDGSTYEVLDTYEESIDLDNLTDEQAEKWGYNYYPSHDLAIKLLLGDELSYKLVASKDNFTCKVDNVGNLLIDSNNVESVLGLG